MKKTLLWLLMLSSKFIFYGTFVQCLFLGVLLAHDGSAQRDEKVVSVRKAMISLSLPGASIEEIFTAIEQKTNYRFFYDRQFINKDLRVSIHANQKKVSDVLLEISREAKLKFKQVNQVINVSPVEKKNVHAEEAVEVILQSISVSGTITSEEDGEGLPGVNVLVKGTSTGTVSDVDGNYKIEVPDAESVLVFSSIGYLSEEIQVGTQTVINVAMLPDIKSLEEIVVIGYGTKKKKDVIGSVSKIDGEDISKMAVSSFDQVLQGLSPGVQVSTQNGVPGAPVQVKIRGLSSVSSGTDPLWIIDGIPVRSGSMGSSFQGETNQSTMSMINPADIESIEVLKDAAATAIYGSRASNGVIIVTTKSGKKGQGTLDFDFKTGISNWNKDDVGIANTSQFFQIMDTAKENTLGPGNVYDPQSDIIDPFLTGYTTSITREEAMATNTKWTDVISQTGKFVEANLSASKGFEDANMFVSLNYRSDDGNIKNSKLQRLTGRINLNYEPVKNLDLGFRLTAAYSDNNRLKSAAGKYSAGGWAQAMDLSMPWMPVYEETDPSGYWNPATGANALAGIDPDLALSDMTSFRTMGNIYLNLKLAFVEGLFLRGEAGFDALNNKLVTWRSEVLREEGNKEAEEQKNDYLSYTYNLRLHYDRQFGDHWISAVAGYERQRDVAHYITVGGKDLPGSYQEVGSPSTVLTAYSRIGGENYFAGYLGRLDYKYKDRYLIGASMRYDGSSKFSSDQRWGTFGALSAGWIISEEGFFHANYVSMLKLRGSFGQTGNQNIPSNINITNFLIKTGTGTYQFLPSTYIQNLGNSSVTWETTNSFDVGLDYGFFGDRLNGSIAYFNQKVTDLLLSVPLPTSAGISGGNLIWDNIGDMKNSGFEFNIDAAAINKGDFSWKIGFNYTNVKNEVLKLHPNVDQTGSGIITSTTITKKGLVLGTYYMAESAGVDPEKGIPLIKEIDAERFEATGETVFTGNIIPATSANLQANRYIHEGKAGLPTYYGGVQNSLTFKNFDLGIYVNFSGGNYIYNALSQDATTANYGIVTVYGDILEDSWKQPGDEAEWPQLSWNRVYNYDSEGNWTDTPAKYFDAPESKFLEKGDFVRLKNITLGYNLPNAAAEKIGLSGLRVYVSGSNLLTFTQFTGWDPEFPVSGNIAGMTHGKTAMPQTKVYSAGVTLKF